MGIIYNSRFSRRFVLCLPQHTILCVLDVQSCALRYVLCLHWLLQLHVPCILCAGGSWLLLLLVRGALLGHLPWPPPAVVGLLCWPPMLAVCSY
jgi:hypothetical protein